MTNLVGSKRILAIDASLYNHVYDALDANGWFSPNPGVRASVEFIPEPLDANKEIKPTKISLSFEERIPDDGELGSNLSVDSWYCYLDIYADKSIVGMGLANELSDILLGKFPSLGFGESRFDVVDPRDGTTAFSCGIDMVEIERSRNYDRAINKFWWTVSFRVSDAYYDDLK